MAAVTSVKSKTEQTKRKTLMIWVASLFLLAVVIFSVTPLTKRQLESNLSQLTGRVISIDGLKLRPLNGQVIISGVGIDCCGDNANRIDELLIDLHVMPLFQRHVVIESVQLNGVRLTVEITDGVLQIAGIATDRFGTEESEAVEEAPGWRVDLTSLLVSDSQLTLDVEGTNHVLTLSNVSVGPVSTRSEFVSNLVSKVEVDGALIDINGNASVQSGLNDAALEVELTIDQLDLARYARYAGEDLQALRGSLTLNQQISLTLGSTFSLKSDGTLAVTGLSVPTLADANEVVIEGQLGLSNAGLEFLEADVVVDTLRQPELGSVKRLSATGLKITDTEFSAKEFLVDGANLTLERAANGRLKRPTIAFLDGASAEEDDQAEARTVGVELFNVSNSQLEFIDRSVEPLVDLSLSEIALTVEAFSLTEPFQVDFVAKHHDQEDARLLVNGNYALGSQSGDISVKLREFEIHEVAPYLGNGVKSGRLRLTSEIGMKKGRIKVANDVYIRNVKVEDRVASGDQMSLSTALFMLKNSDDVVELKVPIETDLNNFNVGLSDIVQRAMLTAARTAAVAYAQYALQPYGSLLLAKNVLGAVTRPKFEPVRFQPASAELGETDVAYMRKLGEFLAAKPELTVTVCGYAQESEIETLRATLATQNEIAGSGKQLQGAKDAVVADQASDVHLLKKLAETRSKIVRDSLLQSGVKASQLYGCTAAVETKDRLPRVELAL